MAGKGQGSKFRWWPFWLRLLVAGGAIALILYLGDWNWGQMAEIIGRLNHWAVLAAIVLFVFGNILVAVRWFILLRTQTQEISFLVCLKIHFLGLFYTNLMLSAVTGDLFRMWYITHHTKRRLESVFSVVVDRIIGIMSLIVLVTLVYRLIPLDDSSGGLKISANLHPGQWVADHWGIPAAISGILGGFFVLTMLIPQFREWISKRMAPIVSQIVRIIRAIGIYSSRPWILILALFITIIAQILPIFGYWLIGQSAQINAPLKYYFLFFPVGWALGTLPINIGVVEGGLVYLFTRIPTVTLEQALVLAVCQRVIGLIGSIPGGLVHLSGMHLPKEVSSEEDFFIDDSSRTDYSK